MSDDIVVELTDHVGTSVDGRRVDLGQYIVMVDGQHVGYLPKVDNAWLACIVALDDYQQAEIMKAVNKKLGQEIKGVASMPYVEPEPEAEPEPEEFFS